MHHIPDWIEKMGGRDEFAFEYFSRKKLPYTEQTMTDTLAQAQDRFSLFCAILALQELGTPRALDALKGVACYPNLDVQGTAVMTIAKIAEGSENAFLAALLDNKTTRNE